MLTHVRVIGKMWIIFSNSDELIRGMLMFIAEDH